jgi:outer membrane protein
VALREQDLLSDRVLFGGARGRRAAVSHDVRGAYGGGVRVAWLLAALSMGGGAAQAQSLVELYRQASVSDPTLAATEAQYRAAIERVSQADAALAPNVALTSSISSSRFTDGVQDEADERRFFSRQTGVQLTQPLYKPVAWRSLKQAQSQAQAAWLQRDQAQAELAQRLATAYFDVLTARSEVEQLKAQQQATAEQLAVAKRSFTVGTASVTDVREAEAKADTVAAQLAVAGLEVEAKLAMLSQQVGVPARVDAQPDTQGRLPALTMQELSNWLDAAEGGSPQIQGAAQALEAARLEVSKAEAGHYPTIELSLSHQNNHASGSTLSSLPQGGRTTQAGINLNLPLYVGGGISARTREAVALQDKAQADVEAARRTVGANVRQAFFGALQAIAQFKGLQTAEKSAETALKANKRGYEVGMRINADVLNAQSQLYQTRRDKARAWHEAWSGFIKLKAATGQVSEDDLARVDGQMQPLTSVEPTPLAQQPDGVKP